FLDSDSAVRSNRSPVRLVIGCLEKEGHRLCLADLRELFRHAPDELLGFNHAGAQDERRLPAADHHGANFERFWFHVRNKSGKQESRKRKLAFYLLSWVPNSPSPDEVIKRERQIKDEIKNQGEEMHFEDINDPVVGEQIEEGS